MKYAFKFIFLILLSLSIKSALPKISISGGSIEELKQSIAEFETILPRQEVYEPKLGFADVYLKKVGDKYDKFMDIVKSNQRLLKLTSASGAFVYCKYINTEFLPNLIKNTASTSMKYLSIFMDSLFKGALNGAWENKGMTGKIVGGLIIYSVVNNMLGIGLKSVTEYFVAGSKKSGEKKAEKKYE